MTEKGNDILSDESLDKLSDRIQDAARDTIFAHFPFEDAQQRGKRLTLDTSNVNASLVYTPSQGFELFIEKNDRTNLSPDDLRAFPQSPLRSLSFGSIRLEVSDVVQALRDLRQLDISMGRGSDRAPQP
jgi:hypothetical protein